MRALPIDAHVDAIREALDRTRTCVVVAPPGAGKTTRVPPALLDAGPCVVLQPRRAAARALARRIAAERGWTEGVEVGWQVRFERRFGRDTRLLIATEGILTARLQSDPLLSGFATVVLDEFHERSVHADLALALAREAMRARDDLRVVVMSATLDPGPVAAYLGDGPTVTVDARPHEVAIEWMPGVAVEEAVRRAVDETPGDVLAFLPGAREIDRARGRLADLVARGIAVLPLHGGLAPDAQDAALVSGDRRRVVLATNLAETSVTVPGVTAVVDSGLHKVMRHDPERGIDRLVVERAPADAVEQRAGRAGRTGPGRAYRLWDPREERAVRRDPELARVDLAPVVLDVLAWGGDPLAFPWFEPPPPERVAAALALLESLGAVEDGRIVARGHALRRLPLHPRLARLVEATGGSDRACAAAAWIAESRRVEGDARTTVSDLLSLADRVASAPAPVRKAFAQVRDLARRIVSPDAPAEPGEAGFLRAVLAAWPDRVARRREPGSPRVLLASGAGATLDPASGVRDAEYLVAVDLAGGRDGPGREARVRLASAVRREWLRPDRVEVVHRYDERAEEVRASRTERLGAIVLAEVAVPPDPERAADLLAERLAALPPGPDDVALERRLRFAGIAFDRDTARRAACAGRTRLPRFRLADGLPADTRATLARLAPETIAVPSGRRVRLDYREDGSVVLSVKLQEMFGLADTPTIGPERVPAIVELLAPSGRPVQATRDLRGFWERGYPEVRRELRGRYPKHPWPDDPWSAPATARPKGRGPRGGRGA